MNAQPKDHAAARLGVALDILQELVDASVQETTPEFTARACRAVARAHQELNVIPRRTSA